MARRKQQDPFSYTTNLNPATAVAANPNGGNLHGLDITDRDLPDFDSNVVAVHPYYCEACQQPFESAGALEEHVENIHTAAVVTEGHRITSAAAARTFMLAGNAYFTLRSAKTGTRFTYRVAAAKPPGEGQCRWCRSNPCRCPQAYFVSLLTGPENNADYQYMGLIKEGFFRRTRNARITEAAPGFKAFAWSFRQLVAGQLPAGLEFWHEGRCGRCGRRLTVPESIAAGIGPECAQYLGRAA